MLNVLRRNTVDFLLGAAWLSFFASALYNLLGFLFVSHRFLDIFYFAAFASFAFVVHKLEDFLNEKYNSRAN